MIKRLTEEAVAEIKGALDEDMRQAIDRLLVRPSGSALWKSGHGRARIMAVVDDEYVVFRHVKCMPVLLTVKDFLKKFRYVGPRKLKGG